MGRDGAIPVTIQNHVLSRIAQTPDFLGQIEHAELVKAVMGLWRREPIRPNLISLESTAWENWPPETKLSSKLINNRRLTYAVNSFNDKEHKTSFRVHSRAPEAEPTKALSPTHESSDD
jgi:hypothetical protein